MKDFINLEDPRKFLINPNIKIQAGTKLQLKFDIRVKEDGLDKKIVNLLGNIPFLLEHGEYPEVPFYEVSKAEQLEWILHYHRILEKIKNELKDIFPEKNSKKFTVFGILAVLIFCPYYHPKSTKFQLAFEASVIMIMLDDVFDSNETSSTPAINLPEVYRISEALQKGNIEEFASLSKALSIPNLTPALNMVEKLFKNIEAEIPGILKDLKYFWIRAINLIRMAQLPISNSADQFLEQKSYISGIDLGVEMRAASLGIKLDNKIRDESFDIMIQNWNILCVILNDIVGINLDQSKKQSKQDNSILRRKETYGEDIKTAFGNIMTIFYQKWQEVVNQMKILENKFPNDTNLQQFLRILKEFYDALIYTYFGHGGYRYGNFDGKYIIEPIMQK